MELETEIDGAFGDYIREAAHLFVTIFHVMDGTEYAKQRKEWTENLYEEIAGDNYETSYANPAYCVEKFGEKIGQYLCWFYARFRDSIVAAFEEDEEEVTRCMELFLQVVSVLSLEEETERYLKETIYYDVHDYACLLYTSIMGLILALISRFSDEKSIRGHKIVIMPANDKFGSY